MPIYKDLSRCAFARELNAYNDSFSQEGAEALYDYLEELSEAQGAPIVFDAVALRCDWTEKDLSDVLSNYGLATLEELRDRTTVIELSGDCVLYQAF